MPASARVHRNGRQVPSGGASYGDGAAVTSALHISHTIRRPPNEPAYSTPEFTLTFLLRTSVYYLDHYN